MNPHPLDRAVFTALTTRQAPLSQRHGQAIRFQPDCHAFGAVAQETIDSLGDLASLAAPGGTIAMVEAGPPPILPGLSVRSHAVLVQMVLDEAAPVADALDYIDLGELDATAMLALATLTAPGPFFLHTHRLGNFIGVKRDGALIAMAGERLKLPGFTEVSALCTHPDHRGQGLARTLMVIVIQRIVARGDVAFLHAYPANPAIPMYRAMGFRPRRDMHYTVFQRP